MSAQELPDSLQEVVKERLERLTRALGDSTGLLPDSLLQEAGMDEMAEMVEDSTLMQLLNLAGYNLIRYQSDDAVFETESKVLTLLSSSEGGTVMNRDGMELSGDTLVFDDNTGRLVSFGGQATFTPEDGNPVLTRQIIFDLNERRGTALDAQTSTEVRAGSWNVRGDCPWVDGDVSFCHRMTFTSCDEEEPHYHFRGPRHQDVSRRHDGRAQRAPLLRGRGRVLAALHRAEHRHRTPVGPACPSSSPSTTWCAPPEDTRGGFPEPRVLLGDQRLRRRRPGAGLVERELHRRERRAALYLEAPVPQRGPQVPPVLAGRGRAPNWPSTPTAPLGTVGADPKMQASFAYASSSAFVRRNSFDPRELTQSIDSEGRVLNGVSTGGVCR